MQTVVQRLINLTFWCSLCAPIMAAESIPFCSAPDCRDVSVVNGGNWISPERDLNSDCVQNVGGAVASWASRNGYYPCEEPVCICAVRPTGWVVGSGEFVATIVYADRLSPIQARDEDSEDERWEATRRLFFDNPRLGPTFRMDSRCSVVHVWPTPVTMKARCSSRCSSIVSINGSAAPRWNLPQRRVHAQVEFNAQGKVVRVRLSRATIRELEELLGGVQFDRASVRGGASQDSMIAWLAVREAADGKVTLLELCGSRKRAWHVEGACWRAGSWEPVESSDWEWLHEE